ncbi:MAG: hypothetical protein V1734_02625 [Nanoarchaeota archaeon]
MKKAQASIEFMFAIGALIMLFLIVFYFVFERRVELNNAENILADKDECHKLAGIITMAFVSGANHTFEIETNASVDAFSKVISAGQTNYPCTFLALVSNATGNLINLQKGNVNVNYANGEVEVKNA